MLSKDRSDEWPDYNFRVIGSLLSILIAALNHMIARDSGDKKDKSTRSVANVSETFSSSWRCAVHRFELCVVGCRLDWMFLTVLRVL